MEQDASAGSLYRGVGVSPLFSGRADQPLVVTTRNPVGLRSELRFASAFAWALVLSGAIAAVAL
jgi:hypothetical protein